MIRLRGSGYQRVPFSRLSVAEQAPNRRIVPSSQRHPLLNVSRVLLRGQCLLGPVPSRIAKPASRNNIAWLIFSAVRDWFEMLGCASELPSHLGRGLVVSERFSWVSEPYTALAIEATALLVCESRSTQSNQFLHGYSSDCGAPYHPDVGINGQACTDTVRQPQVHARILPASPPSSL